MKILFLAANPQSTNRLNLGTEVQEIEEGLRRAKLSDRFQLVQRWEVRPRDLRRALLEEEPDIVHFSGHGEGQEGLVLVDDAGKPKPATGQALVGLFIQFPQIKCVLLNACYAEVQAQAIVEHIDYVIGMRDTILDDAAIAFTTGFYDGLGYGRTIEDAFELGRNAILWELSSFSNTTRKMIPVDFVKTESPESLPEQLKPILLKKTPNIAPNSPIPLNQNVPSADEIQLNIDKTLETDAKVKQYREQVKAYLSDRKLEDYEKDLLKALRDELGLSPEKANEILEEELAPIRQAKQAYATRLNLLIKYYPFTDAIETELQKFQMERNLTDEEVAEISRSILEQAEIAYQEKLKREARQRYEQEFIIAINAGYPLEDGVRNGLRNFQQSLKLSDEDIEQIEQPLIAPKEAEYQQKLAEAQRQREREEKAREQARQQQAEEAKRKREQEEEREKQLQLELERQRQQEKRRERMKTPLDVKLQQFEFDVITVDKNGKENSRTHKSAEFFAEDLGTRIFLEMVLIPRGTYLMGSSEGQGQGDERPQNSVTVSSFFIGKYPITQAQWRAVATLPQVEIPLNPAPSNFIGDSRPVEQVSWHEAVEFCQRLSRFTGHQYRLPSEAEWEYS